ncbi:MAG: GNAT family N-acetyltransferase, partial [Candidatus Delongbacteria bacterium]
MTKTCLLKNGEEYTLCQLQETDAEKLLLYTKKVAGETNNLTFSPDEFTASVDDE